MTNLLKIFRAHLLAPSGEGGSSPTPAPAASPPGGGQSTPAPAPSGASPVAVEGADDSGVDWNSFANDFVPPAEAPPTPLVPEPSPAATAPATAVEPPAEPNPAVAQPAEPDADKASKQPNPVEQAIAELNSPEWQGERLKQLAQSYQLSEAEKEALETNPSEAMPQLAAKLHLRMMFSVGQMVANMMEQMLVPVIDNRVGHHGERAKLTDMAEKMIFSKYDKLRGVDSKTMDMVVANIRKSSPNIKGDEALQRVAATIYGMNGWAMPTAGKAAAPSAPTLAPYSPVAPGALPAAQPRANGSAQVDEQGTDWSEFTQR